MRNFLIWLAARVLFVLAVTFTLTVGATVGIAKYDTTLTSQVLWLAGLSVLCYGGFLAVWLTQHTKEKMRNA